MIVFNSEITSYHNFQDNNEMLVGFTTNDTIDEKTLLKSMYKFCFICVVEAIKIISHTLQKSLLNVLKTHWKTRQNPHGLLLHLCHVVLAPESSKIRQSDGSKNTRRKTKKSLKLHQKFVKMLWLQQTTWMMVKRLPYSNPKPFVIEKNSGNRWTSVAII